MKKMNSYIKMAIALVVSGLIGGLIGFGTSHFDTSIANIFGIVTGFIQKNTPILMTLLLIMAAVVCILCYKKEEDILKQILRSEDDDKQELLDQQYDFWSNFGMTASNIITCLAIILFAFPFSILSEISGSFFSFTIIAFLLCTITCIVYQIAAVKQIKRKDPVKYDDVMSLNFQKNFLLTCDEGEKQVIYQSAYNTFILMNKVMMILLVIALMSHVLFGNGLLAVILLGALYITMTISYTVYVTKLQKTQING